MDFIPVIMAFNAAELAIVVVVLLLVLKNDSK